MKDLLTDEMIQKLDTFLRKVATNKIKSGYITSIDYDDLVQEYWLMVMDIIEKTDAIDFAYISKACNYKTGDLIRKSVRRNTVNVIDLTDCSETFNFEDCFSTSSKSSNFNPEEKVLTLGILDLFEKDSKERLLIDAWLKILGIDETSDISKLPKSAEETYIAQLMGYKDSSSSGYAKIKKRVRVTLIDEGYYI